MTYTNPSPAKKNRTHLIVVIAIAGTAVLLFLGAAFATGGNTQPSESPASTPAPSTTAASPTSTAAA